MKIPNTRKLHVLSLLLALFICLASSFSAQAQDNVTGSFEGTVRDGRTGNPIAGATVRITNTLTGVSLSTQTDAAGRFKKGLLTPSDYTLEISADNFVSKKISWPLPAMKPTQIIPEEQTTLTFAGQTSASTTTPQPTPTTQTTTSTSQQTSTSTTASTSSTTSGTSSGPPPLTIASDIQTTDGRRDGLFSEKEVSTIPLGGTTLTRSFDELGFFVPGVTPPPQTFGSVSGPGIGPGVGSAGQFSINGMRSRSNNFTVDGSDNNDEDIGVRRQGFFALVPQSVESIKEFQIITLLAPAQYGRNVGGQVNAISRSGGSETHGTIYGLFNSSQLNARNPFDTVGGNTFVPLRAGNKPVLIDGNIASVRLNNGDKDSSTLGQGGFVIGGPFVQQKLFYFIAIEGQNLNANKETHFAVPTIKERGVFGSGDTGLVRDPLTNAIILGGAFPTSLNGDTFFSYFPFPNNSAGPYGPNTYTEVLPAGAQSKLASGRMDANFSAFGREHSLSGRYNFTQDWRDIPAVGGGLYARLRPRVRTQNLSLFLNTQLTSSVSNQLRLSYGRTRLIFDEGRDTNSLLPTERGFNNPQDAQFLLNRPRLLNDTLPGDAAVFYGTSGTTESEIGPIGQLVIAGYSPVGVDVFNFPQRRVDNTYQFADSLSFRRGSHAITIGTDNRRTELFSDQPRNARPLVTFTGAPRIIATPAGDTFTFRFANANDLNPLVKPQDFAAAGAPSGFFQSLVERGRDANIGLRYYQWNVFGQDEWRISRNFTLSYGLRYEYNTPPSEANNLIEDTFSSPALSLVPGLNTFIAGRTRIFDIDQNNFAPRVSFAYSPHIFGDKVTVIRGGYGLYYDQILGAVVSQSRNVFPTFSTINFGGGCNEGCGDFDFDVFNPMTTLFLSNGQFLPIVQPGTLNTRNPLVSLPSLVSISSDFFGNFFDVPGNSTFGTTLPEAKLETPLAHQYSVTLEQQLSQHLVVSAAYVGTLGRNLLRVTTPNLGPNFLLAPLFANYPGGQPVFGGAILPPGSRFNAQGALVGGRPVNSAGSVSIFDSSARSRYDAFQTELRGRFNFAGSTEFRVNYTLSTAKDDASDVFDLAGAPALPQNSSTFAGEYGPANFDAKHRISYSYVSDLPHFENRGLQLLLGGVQLAGAGQYQTGQPFTVNSLFDVNTDGNLTDRINSANGIVQTDSRSQPLQLTVNPITLLAPIGQDGQVARNTFRSSSLFYTSFAVIKTFTFGEQRKLAFRTEVFNPWNRSNFGVPVRFLEAPSFGRAVDTVTTNRRIQFGLKLIL